MKYTGAEIIIRLLEKKGIEIIAGIPGSANLPLYKVLHDALELNEPVFVNVPIHYSEHVFPMGPPGESNKSMIG